MRTGILHWLGNLGLKNEEVLNPIVMLIRLQTIAARSCGLKEMVQQEKCLPLSKAWFLRVEVLLKSPASFKRKAYTPLRTQYCLRETVVPIQPLSHEQHGNDESPSKITRRISSTEDGEDPLSPDGKDIEKPKKRRATKKDKQERTSGERIQSSTKQSTTKRAKKLSSEMVPVASIPSESFSTTPKDATVALSLPVQVLPTVTTHSTALYTPKPLATTHVSPNQDHLITDVPPSPSDASTISTECNISVVSDGKDVVASLTDKHSPISDPKSISLTPFNMEVDLLNNEDSKSVGSPAVVTIDPTAAHSPVGECLATSLVADCDPNEGRPFVEGTKKTAAIISKSSPKRPSLLPLRRRSLSASNQSGMAARIPVGGKERRKSEGERNMVSVASFICQLHMVFVFNR